MIWENHLSFLTYGLIVWGDTCVTTLNTVVVLQKKAVQIITYSNRDAHSSPLFSQLGLIKLMDLVIIHTAFLCFTSITIYYLRLLTTSFHLYHLSMGIVKLLGLHSPDNQTQPTHGYSARLASKSTYYIDQN